MQTSAEIQELLDRYLDDRMTQTERLRFRNLLQEPANNERLAAAIEVVLQEHRYQDTSDMDKDILFQQLIRKSQPATVSIAAHRIYFLKTAWFKYAAAVLILCCAGVYFWNNPWNGKELATTNDSKHLQKDIPPGGEKAILTLADGSKIILDNAANGNLAQQGNAQVVKLFSGQIAYNVKGASGKDVMWNTLTTPAGGQYQVTLPDGTKVWLNAASAITYPTAFVDPKRSVKISGEVYFEVAKDNKKPFIVDVNGKSSVQVLGTSFNISSYEDEASIKTTLLEGSVKVIRATASGPASDRQPKSGTNGDRSQSVILRPGQQAVLKDIPGISVIDNPDIEQTLAWKNGLFNFNGADLHGVMRQLERWYDIKVNYEGSVPGTKFSGEIYRNVHLSDVLEALQRMGIKYRLDGKTLTVL